MGFLAAGKTTVAASLAAATGRRGVDVDTVVTRLAGASLPEIFARGGPVEIRDREHRALLDLPADVPLVVATGAGCVEWPDTLELLRERGLVVWLDAPWTTTRRRLQDPEGRHRAEVGRLGWAGLAALDERRRPMYARAAHLRLLTDRRDPTALGRMVLARALPWRANRGVAV